MYVPGSAARLLDQLGIAEHERTFEHVTRTPPARTIDKPEGVFPRYVDQAA